VSSPSPSPLFGIVLWTIPIHADELIDDIAAGETAPGCSLMIHEPAFPISKIDGKHQAVASMTVHAASLGDFHLSRRAS
jgi:hypothetical protein